MNLPGFRGLTLAGCRMICPWRKDDQNRY